MILDGGAADELVDFWEWLYPVFASRDPHLRLNH